MKQYVIIFLHFCVEMSRVNILRTGGLAKSFTHFINVCVDKRLNNFTFNKTFDEINIHNLNCTLF